MSFARRILYSTEIKPSTPEALRLLHRDIQDRVFSVRPAWDWDSWELSLFHLELERALISKLKY